MVLKLKLIQITLKNQIIKFLKYISTTVPELVIKIF